LIRVLICGGTFSGAFHIHSAGIVAVAATLAETGAELMADIRLI
jgi:hypothetical protein